MGDIQLLTYSTKGQTPTTGGVGREAVDALTRINRREDWLEEQNLPLLHRLVFGISGRDLIQALQQHSDSFNDQDAMERTAHPWAAARGNNDVVTTLLHFNANPDIMVYQHSGPVSYAADRNYTVCARILLAAGADPDPTILGGYKIGSPLNCAACNANDLLLIKTFLEYGANVDACGVDGRTPCIHAARTNNVDFAQVLLEHNANINTISTAGQTPLTTAIYSVCPRLMGPNLQNVTTQYADLQTLTILQNEPLRLKHDKKYSTDDSLYLSSSTARYGQRNEADFWQLMALVRALAARQSEHAESLMEKGIFFDGEKLGMHSPTPKRTPSVVDFASFVRYEQLGGRGCATRARIHGNSTDDLFVFKGIDFRTYLGHSDEDGDETIRHLIQCWRYSDTVLQTIPPRPNIMPPPVATAIICVARKYHMDIKPGNFIIDKNDHMVLDDWEQADAPPTTLAPEADGTWDVEETTDQSTDRPSRAVTRRP
ncbi:ankyrin repeat-containing domain protein [Dactylonectria macrodidyma]|uniref:Ankyrin repeat-containing domain protein n=1 Tax=Dactylonectria macrodidyma TaxID=307937 RepID=A0A9P9JN31_9HYPO|nr:ankyrin repeat-containing domain protein [Dactylonectria macrodidyma]